MSPASGTGSERAQGRGRPCAQWPPVPGYSSAGKSRSYSSPLRRAPTSSGYDGRMASSQPPSNGSEVIVSGDPSTAGLTSTTTPETAATTSQTAADDSTSPVASPPPAAGAGRGG